MTYPTEEQEALMRKYKLRPEHWIVYQETATKLVLLNKRKSMRRVLEKEKKE